MVGKTDIGGLWSKFWTSQALYDDWEKRNTPGTDVDRLVADYHLRIHVNFWQMNGSPTVNNLRCKLFKKCFIYGTSTTTLPPSSIGQELLRIVEKYDRDMKVLKEI